GGVPGRAPAHRLPGTGRRAVPGALAGPSAPRRQCQGRVPTGDDYPLATGRTRVREVAAMADRITLEVTRYRPEQETEPVLQSYEVPLRADWAILDGLNYVKDTIDGTLSYRWSCRMGICGSCGMTVNGEPKLS